MVSGSLSAFSEGNERNGLSPLFTYTEKFYEQFPYYLSIGMTYDQYWNDDCDLVKYYRQAEEIRNERKNQELWLQGLYVYEAICDVSPVIHAFAKKGTKPIPYVPKPYPLNAKQRIQEEEEKERKIAEKGKKIMESFMCANNKRFKEKAQKQ